MGANNSTTQYAKVVPYSPPENDGESPVYISSSRLKENGGIPITTFRNCPEANTLTKLLDTSTVKYGDKDGFGERILNSDGTYGDYKFLSYKEFHQQCLYLAAGMREVGLKKGDSVGIYSYSSVMWQMIFYACQYSGLIPVPIYDSLGPGSAKYIINHAECKAIFTIDSKLEAAEAACVDSTVQNIFIITKRDIDSEEKIHKTATDVIEIGKRNFEKFEIVNPSPDDVSIYIYTSGSTGNPKGCILLQKSLIAGSAGLGNVDFSIASTDVYFSFLPLAHVYEMCVQTLMIAQGVAIGYYTGNIKNLMNDIGKLQPTIMCSVPRVFNRVCQAMNEKINKLPWPLPSFINWSINSKNNALVEKRPISLLNEILFSKFRSVLGGRIRLIVSGGAPILPEVYKMIRSTISTNIIQGYGLTEISAGGSVQYVGSNNPGDVGVVCISMDMKLRNVPGFDYNPLGSPPTGEILFLGDSLFRGYYKNPQITDEVLQDGWFATGDVGMITEEGHLQIIDRVKQLVKLSQGEYLALSTLTEQYQETEGVDFIYIYADSHHNAPVALVVPSQSKIKEWEDKGITNFKESNEARLEIIDLLNKKAKELGLRGFERIADIAFDDVPFTTDNGLLTPSQKPQFKSLYSKYASILVQVYQKNPQLLG